MKNFLIIISLLLNISCIACSQQQNDLVTIPEADLKIYNYQQCVKFGGVMLKTYPPQCKTKDGQIFKKFVEHEESACKDLCGDGVCQEIVCMAVGCPCPESLENCQIDCKE